MFVEGQNNHFNEPPNKIWQLTYILIYINIYKYNIYLYNNHHFEKKLKYILISY
jgi:hypothetical protein